MKIKKGDKVLIISGKDRGKVNRVLKVLPRRNKVVVEGLNVVIKHRRPRRLGEKGERVKIAAPLVVSKVKLICPHCQKATRVGYKVINRSKKRFCKKCGRSFT